MKKLMSVLVGTAIVLGIISGCQESSSDSVYEPGNALEGESIETLAEGDQNETVEEEPPIKVYEPGQGIALDQGPLQVIDGQLCNASGQAIQLKGMSSHGLQWSGSMITEGSMTTLVEDWGIDIFRGAMYTTQDGYTSKAYKNFNLMRMESALELATKKGIYYMVDWHVLQDKDPMVYLEQAKDFFDYMSYTYQTYDNIIYEICNEPNGQITWQDNVKPYAETIIPIIRANDPDAVIIVGSPSWSQDVDIAAADPLDFDNVLYTLHFYAGSHGQELRDKAIKAMELGIGLFVTEWGTTASTGSGDIYPEASDTWLAFLDQYQISWCNWSFSSQGEGSAALLVHSDPNGNWTEDRLTESGKYVKNQLAD